MKNNRITGIINREGKKILSFRKGKNGRSVYEVAILTNKDIVGEFYIIANNKNEAEKIANKYFSDTARQNNILFAFTKTYIYKTSL